MEKLHPSLHHLFWFNGVKYGELKNKEHIDIVNEMVDALNRKEYDRKLLWYGEDSYVNLIYPGHQTNVEFDCPRTLVQAMGFNPRL